MQQEELFESYLVEGSLDNNDSTQEYFDFCPTECMDCYDQEDEDECPFDWYEEDEEDCPSNCPDDWEQKREDYDDNWDNCSNYSDSDPTDYDSDDF